MLISGVKKCVWVLCRTNTNDAQTRERKTAAETLKGLSSEAELEEVKDFDFVSPRAVMEEYMGNMYALRGAGADDGF